MNVAKKKIRWPKGTSSPFLYFFIPFPFLSFFYYDDGVCNAFGYSVLVLVDRRTKNGASYFLRKYC